VAYGGKPFRIRPVACFDKGRHQGARGTSEQADKSSQLQRQAGADTAGGTLGMRGPAQQQDKTGDCTHCNQGKRAGPARTDWPAAPTMTPDMQTRGHPQVDVLRWSAGRGLAGAQLDHCRCRRYAVAEASAHDRQQQDSPTDPMEAR